MPGPTDDKIANGVAALLRAPHRVYWIANRLQILVGMVLIVAAAVSGQRLIPALLQGQQVSGTIVGHAQVHWVSQSSTGAQFHSPFMPVVEFSDRGQVYRFQDVAGSNSNGGVGDRVIVLVNRQEPQASVIARGFMNWMPWGPMLVVGVLLLGAGLAGFRRHRWNGPS